MLNKKAITFMIIVVIALFLFIGISGASAEPVDHGEQFWNATLQSVSTHNFEGTVNSVESRYIEEDGTKRIYSFATISVDKNIKGLTGKEITLTYEGGTIHTEDGGIITRIVFINPWGVINCKVGDTIRVFARKDDKERTAFRAENVEILNRIEEDEGNEAMSRSSSLIQIKEFYQCNFAWNGPNWDGGSPVEWWLNEDGTDDISGTGEFNAVKNAFNTWENEGLSNKDYTYKGTTSRGWDSDGYNVVLWDDYGFTSWLAKTEYTYGWWPPWAPPWVEWDIRFNDYWDWCIGLVWGDYDVQNTATHEGGHTLNLLDLYHSSNQYQTMYYSTDSYQTNKRTLESGDKAGIQYIYPRYSKPSTDITDPADSATVEGTVQIKVSASSSLSWVKFHAFEDWSGGYSSGWTSMTYSGGKWVGYWDTTETIRDGWHSILVRSKSSGGMYGYDKIQVYVLNG